MLAKSWSCRWGKNGKLYSRERAYEVDKNALITWRIFPVCATTPFIEYTQAQAYHASSLSGLIFRALWYEVLFSATLILGLPIHSFVLNLTIFILHINSLRFDLSFFSINIYSVIIRDYFIPQILMHILL